MSGQLRVLPLGGVGEIGKNMTVVEYDGAILVVDVGLRFPTAEQVGIDLVLPDFTYLRERADDIEGIVITHGHEDHLGALPFVLRELKALDIPVVKTNRLDDLQDDPHLAAVGLFQRYEHPEAGAYFALRPPVRYSATPANIRRHPPRLGEHTDEVLAEVDPREEEQ